MSRRKGSGVQVTITTTVDLASAAGQLLDDERAVMQAHEQRVLRAVKDQWTGWVYAGRPAGAAVNVSRDAWFSELQTTRPPYALTIYNAARTKKGELYAGYVHRAGTSTLEADEVVKPMIEQRYWPAIVADLDRAIKANIGKPRTVGKRVRADRKGATERVGGGGQTL